MSTGSMPRATSPCTKSNSAAVPWGAMSGWTKRSVCGGAALGVCGRAALDPSKCLRAAESRAPQVELKNQMTDPCLTGQREICSHCERKKTSPRAHLVTPGLRSNPASPCNVGWARVGVALTEMVVYFATGNFPPSGQDLSQTTLQRRGRRGRRRIMRGRLFRSGRTPAFHEALFRKRDSGPTRPTPWELWLLCRE